MPGAVEIPADAAVHDAIVVGAGAAGGWAAKQLCEGGLSVLLLEAGPDLDPQADFPLPAPAELPLASRAIAALRGQGIQARCSAFSRRTGGLFVSDRRNPYTTPETAPFNWFRSRIVGGRLHLWARVCLRLEPGDLARWPLGYRDLEPAYQSVESVMEVRAPDPTPAEERFGDQISAEVGPVPMAAPEPERVPRTIRMARETGRLTMRPDTVVTRIALGPGGQAATGVEYADRRTGRTGFAAGRAVVLAPSAIETLRLLLASGLGGRSGRLGIGVMDHVMSGIWGPLRAATPDPAGPYRPAEDSADPYDLGAGTGFLIRNPGFGIQGGMARTGDSWYLLAHGRMAPSERNRVTLDPDVTDEWGVPAARVEVTHSDPEDRLAAEEQRTMSSLAQQADLKVRSGGPLASLALRVAGGRIRLPSGAFVPGSAAHEVGGAMMGSDPDHSVTDPWGRLWDVPNVVVADGALFPDGCWQNSTLTVMALAVRAAERVLSDAREGRLPASPRPAGT